MNRKRGSRPRAYFDLMRPLNCVMGGLATVLAIFIALEGDAEQMLATPIVVVQGFLIAFFFTFAGNALNDYFDREVDRDNHPGRPIPRGDMKPREALYTAATLFALLVLWSFFVTWWAFLIVSSSALLMVGYEVRLKASGLPGNVTISWLTGCAFLFGGSVVDRMTTVALMALLAFLASTGREIVKDIEDMGGDRDRRTLPMRIGQKRSATVAAVGFGAAVAFSPAPFILDIMGIWYVLPVVLADVMFIYSAVLGFSNPRRAQRIAKVGMLFGMLAFFIGTLVNM